MQEVRTVTATVITRPACRMIIKRGIRANDYFSYCDEVGCDIWDVLAAVPNRLDDVALVNLPHQARHVVGRLRCDGSAGRRDSYPIGM